MRGLTFLAFWALLLSAFVIGLACGYRIETPTAEASRTSCCDTCTEILTSVQANGDKLDDIIEHIPLKGKKKP